jgi:hypothetical protein
VLTFLQYPNRDPFAPSGSRRVKESGRAGLEVLLVPSIGHNRHKIGYGKSDPVKTEGLEKLLEIRNFGSTSLARRCARDGRL